MNRREFLKFTSHTALLASFQAYGVPQILTQDVSGAIRGQAATDVQCIKAFMAQYFAAESACTHEISEIAASDIESRFTSDFISAFRKLVQRDWSDRQAHPPVVLEIQQEGDSAKVVANEPSGEYVYTLQRTHAGWRINQIAWKCCTCDGIGSEGDCTCIDCHGEGWKYGDAAHLERDFVAPVKIVPENLVASGLLLKDAKKEAATEIDIRELADMHSVQFYHSRLSVGQRIGIVLTADEGELIKAFYSLQDEISCDVFQHMQATVTYLAKLRDEPELRQQTLLDSAARVDIEDKAIEAFMQMHFAKCIQISLGDSLGRNAYLASYFTPKYWRSAETDFVEQRQGYMLSHPHVVLSIERDGDNATVVTSEPYSDGSDIGRGIYHLKRSAAGWRIDRRGGECNLCMGAGLVYEKVCEYCNGEKWRYSGASAR